MADQVESAKTSKGNEGWLSRQEGPHYKFKRGKERLVHLINYRKFMELEHHRLGGG